MYRNVKGEVRDRRRALQGGMWRRASNASDTAFNVWWRNGVRKLVMDKEFLHIRKFGEDPNLVETEVPTLFDWLNIVREQDDHDAQVELARRAMIEGRKKLNETESKLYKEIEQARYEYAELVFAFEYTRDGDDCYYEGSEHVMREYWNRRY
jgi:hypothetical protein